MRKKSRARKIHIIIILIIHLHSDMDGLKKIQVKVKNFVKQKNLPRNSLFIAMSINTEIYENFL